MMRKLFKARLIRNANKKRLNQFDLINRFWIEFSIPYVLWVGIISPYPLLRCDLH